MLSEEQQAGTRHPCGRSLWAGSTPSLLPIPSRPYCLGRAGSEQGLCPPQGGGLVGKA